MTFCVQRYINLHEFGHLLLFFLEYVARIGRAAALSVPFFGLADGWAVAFSKYKTRGKSENYLLLSGKNHEAFQKQHFPGQPLIPFQGGLVKQENQ